MLKLFFSSSHLINDIINKCLQVNSVLFLCSFHEEYHNTQHKWTHFHEWE